MKRRSVTQEHGTGCAVACTAFVLNLSYKKALSYFSRPNQAWGRGFYCKEVIEALAAAGKKYSLGHYLVRTSHGDWMNPWMNFPVIAPAKSAFQKRLPGRPIYAVFPID